MGNLIVIIVVALILFLAMRPIIKHHKNKGNDLKSGDIIVDEETVYAVDITDGKFCANGTPENIDVKKDGNKSYKK